MKQLRDEKTFTPTPILFIVIRSTIGVLYNALHRGSWPTEVGVVYVRVAGLDDRNQIMGAGYGSAS